jgi:DNA-binding CsgD family transcriptional regulator
MKKKNIIKDSILRMWNYITQLDIDKAHNGLKSLQIQLINQYNFLLALIFFSYSLRDLYYGLYESFYILGSFSILLLFTLFFTKLRLNKHILLVICAVIALIIFYFSSYTGITTGTYMYNFALLSATLFLFSSKERSYIIILYIFVTVLFLINCFTDFKLFFNPKYASPILVQKTFILTFVQTLTISFINGIYLHKRLNLHARILRSKHRFIKAIASKDSTIAKLENKTSKPLLFDTEELIAFAKSSPKNFINQFHQDFPTLFDQLSKINPKITETEFRTLALIRVGCTSKEISNLEYVSIRTVETRKNRIRKKFELSPNSNIYLWLKNIEQDPELHV